MKRKRLRGVTLLEVLVVAGLTTVIMLILGQATVLSKSTFDKVGNVGYHAVKGRQAFDRVVSDVNSAEATLAQYPWYGTPAFTAADDAVLILRLPKFDASGVRISGDFDIVIYKVRAATRAEEGPKVLERHTAIIDDWNAGAVVFDRVLTQGISAATLNIEVNQLFWGDQNTTEFYLLSPPAPDTADIELQALVGGVDRLADGNATYSSGKVTFVKAPNYAVAVDTTYRCYPNNSVDSSGSNGGTSVLVRFKFSPKFRDAAGNQMPNDLTLSARPRMLNSQNWY